MPQPLFQAIARFRPTLGAFLVVAGVPVAASGAVLTVGAGGAYATIQAALTQAHSTGAADEIRIRAGIYSEHLVSGTLTSGNDLEISGGWDATFTVRDPDPATTVVDAEGTGRALSFGDVLGAHIVVRGLTLRAGLADPTGGGLLARLYGTSRLRVDACDIRLNDVSSTNLSFGAAGGGLFVSANESSRLEILDSFFVGNSALHQPATGTARGGGVQIAVSGSATAFVRRCLFEENSVSGGSHHSGAGLYVYSLDSALVRLEDVGIGLNHGGSETEGSGLTILASGDSTVDARRVAVYLNHEGSDGSNQVELIPIDTAEVRFSDSLVAGGVDGLEASAGSTAAVLRLVNLTVATHTGMGAQVTATLPAVASVSNSIFWANNGANSFSGDGITTQANLIGVDPLFVHPPSLDYNLASGSPAVNAGIASPLGGLSFLDLEHRPRRAGSLPDLGALERNAIFGDDFEYGSDYWWGWVP